MSKSTRSRSYLRGRRGLTSRLSERAGGAGSAESSRGAAIARPAVDVLEPRQLLFSLTITQDDIDPVTGVGVAFAYFGYFIPSAFTPAAESDSPSNIVTEDLNDEIPNAGGLPNPQNIPAVVTLSDSNIRLSHNVTPANNMQITANPLTPEERRIQARLSGGQFFTFSPLDESGNTTAVSSFSFDILPGQGSSVGLNAQTMQVDLFFNGQLIASYTGAQLLAQNTNNPNSGVGRFQFDAPQGFAGFTALTIRANAGPNDAFLLDNISETVPAGRFVAQVSGRTQWGVEVALAGQVGTTVQFFDLYGRDMIQTIAIGQGDGNLVLFDVDDNGVPDGNDGIGRIVLSNTDRTSGLSMFGGTITYSPGAADQDADFVENGFVFKRVENLNGLYDDFEAAGFGFDVDPTNHVMNGLPSGGNGSIIVGSPFVRDLGNYNPSGNPIQNGQFVNFPFTGGFARSDQGVFVTGGRAMGSIYIHGMLFGSSQVTGAIDRFNVSTLYGSLTVNGDLGALIVANDAGLWERDSGQPDYVFSHRQVQTQTGAITIGPFASGNITTGGVAKTNGQLVVGRTVGSVIIGGRSLLDVTVQGDINDPVNKPPRDVAKFYEREFAYANDPGSPEPEVVIFETLLNSGIPLQVFTNFGQAGLLGTDFLRNDTLLSADWVGSLSTGVRIVGDLSGRDQINTGDDQADVFAFASDGTTPLTVQTDATVWFRILDAQGRTVAAPEFQRGLGFQNLVRYQPTEPGVYYLVITDPAGDDADFGVVSYTATILGMAPVTLGEYRTGASSGLGATTQTGQVLNNSVTLLSGNAGTIRIGTGFVNGAGTETSAVEITNTAANDDDVADWLGGTFSVPGNLYNITTGSDIAGASSPVRVVVGGDFGTLLTGRSGIIGVGPTEGDVNNFTLDVGGRIAALLVGGGSGINQDNDTDPLAISHAPGTTQYLSGGSGGDGSVGMVRYGSHIANDAVTMRTSSNSVVGAFLVSQDIDLSDTLRQGLYFGNQGITLTTGSGSDVRFTDFPRIDLRAAVNTTFPLIGGQSLELVDDGGGRVILSVSNVPVGFSPGFVRALPVANSAGVALAQIVVSLAGGAVLNINGVGNAGAGDVISIGKIIVNGADGAAGISITGNIEVDVWKIETAAPLSFITNQTAGGDLVAIDANGLTTLTLGTGSLGRTQVPGWGPRLIGPFVGIGGTAGFQQTALTLPAASTGFMSADWNNQLYRGVSRANLDGGQAFLDDLGSPFDPYLNGLVVRNGNLDSVSVGGQTGDVIVSAGNLRILNANADRVAGASGFDGIVGTVYATNIDTVDVGDGLEARTPSPLANSGIFAVNDIRLVTNGNSPRAIIAGVITASNSIATDPLFNGIQTVSLTGAGGGFDGAYISSSNLDNFFLGFNYADNNVAFGDIQTITGTDVNLSRSNLFADNLTTLTLTRGVYDATFTVLTSNAGTISAAGYSNTTLTGEQTEFRVNGINIGGDLFTLTTIGQAGDIKDLVLDVSGTVTGEISARSIDRTALDIDNVLTLLRVTQDIRGSSVTVGRVPQITVGRRAETTKFTVAGLLERFTAADSIVNSDISVIGPFGQINTITAANLISGSISASGPIGTVESTAGSIAARVTTTTDRGNITLLKAAVDLDVRTDISGTLDSLVAGRHIGSRANPGVVVIRGNLNSAMAGGQLYSDLRVGQAVVGEIKIGRVSSLPSNNQLGSGSIFAFGPIKTVTIAGDFDGNIISYSGGIDTVTITDGSFYPDRLIAAYDGHINGVTISNGNLYGDLYADWILFGVSVLTDPTKDPAGVFGDIGVNDAFNSSQPTDGFRNALPVGVAATPNVDGPSIRAGWNVGRVFVSGGSMFETSIVAGRAVGFVDVRGSITNDAFTPVLGSVIAAGDSIYAIGVQGDFNLAWVLSGVVDLGSDLRPGGTGAAKDTGKSGWINDVYVAGNAFALVFSAGLDSGTDGVYNTGDDLVVPGVSFINFITVPGTITAVSAFSDSVSQALAAESRIFLGGTQVELEDPTIDPGFPVPGRVPIGAAGVPFSNNAGRETGIIYFGGPGQAYWDAAAAKVVLVNTDLSSALTVALNAPSDGSRKTLTSFSIVTNDDASVGALYVDADLVGASLINIDAYAQTITIAGNVLGTTKVKIGGDLGTFNVGDFRGGSLSAKQTAYVNVGGDYGAANLFTRNEVKMDLLAIGFLTINGAARGAVNIERDITSFKVVGAMEGASLRAGASIGGFEAGSLSRSLVSAEDYFGGAVIRGAMFDSALMAGVDLGTDAEFGGSGLAADSVSSGFMGNVSVAGDFLESDVVAGILRGPDGYFGTSDDSIAEGRSTIGTVTITGTQVGSNRGSESYRISSTGTLGVVTIGGVPGTAKGNFAVGANVLPPLPFQVTDLSVRQESKTYTARLSFNQPVNSSSLASSLVVSEVRNNGLTEIRLVNGVDYTIAYDAASNTALVVFSRAVTDRNLPQQSDLPGPGLYRFTLVQSLARAQLARTTIDGDRDGHVEPADDYSDDAFVGDAGDKIVSERITVGNPAITVDMYRAGDLSAAMDDNRAPDGLPDANRTYTINGAIGDHPDNDSNFFRFSGDVDAYRITLQAGQILRLGRLTGPAQLANIAVYDASGAPVNAAQALPLPFDAGLDTDATFEQNYLVKATGTYYIVVGNPGTEFAVPGEVPNPNVEPQTVGDYSFTVTIFDDGNSGFSAPTDAGNGSNIVNAPTVQAFAGVDGQVGTADDLAQIQIGTFTFTRNGDTVVGVDASGTISSYRNPDGTLVSYVNSAIGPAAHSGVPIDVYADVDVYHLNNRLAIETGTRLRVTVKLVDFGSDLGSRSQIPLVDVQRSLAAITDYRGNVQFAVFDTSASTAADDAVLVFSPTDFSPNGGTPNTVIASSENATYGYDANGDFYIEFLAPGRIGSGLNGTYAVYLQGAFNTDYQLEVVQLPDAPTPLTKVTQNVLLETRGGTIDWLESGGRTSTLLPFMVNVLGFNGAVQGGQSVQDYILTTLTNNLQSIYDNAGVSVRFSTNPNDFEFEEFSTVYLTSSADPVSQVFNSLLFTFATLAGTGLIQQPYGFSEHSDPFNADHNDEAAVFLPNFAVLGYTPTQADVDLFTQSLTSAVGRRVGELLGLRITNDYAIGAQVNSFDIQSALGVNSPPGPGKGYSLVDGLRPLSDRSDSITRTDFFLGRQNALSLLDKYLLGN